MTRSATVYAPAKINPCLHVLGKRPDGYHEVAMLMQRIDLHDRIAIRIDPRPGVRIQCEGLELEDGEENIAALAARRMVEIAGGSGGVEIELEKQIPVAAGLGGGSSDAAAVLMALDGMLGLDLGRDRLMAEGARLGADVPFFIFGGPAWATGVGDRLERVDGLPDVWYVLVNPGVAVSTAWVYRNLGLTSRGRTARMPGFFGTAQAFSGMLHNDLEQVTEKHFPVIGEIKRELVGLGALGALMSGSGPTVFGVFESEGAARRAAAGVRRRPNQRVVVARPLPAARLED